LKRSLVQIERHNRKAIRIRRTNRKRKKLEGRTDRQNEREKSKDYLLKVRDRRVTEV